MHVFLLSVPPRITPFVFEDNPLHEGQYVQVICIAPEGDLPIQIEWTLNGKQLSEFSEVQAASMGRRSSLLTIEAVSYTHVGNYSCRASNKAGDMTYSSQLLVNGIDY